MKRIAVAILLLLVGTAVPAAAAPGDAVEVELTGIQGGAVVEGTISLTASASSAAGIRRIEIAINDQVVEKAEPSGLKRSAEISYAWITPLELSGGGTAPNGEYSVTATAVANGGADAATTERVIVDNPAATPTGLTAEPTAEGIALSWAPNPEPDLLGYLVERGTEDGFEVLAQTTETSTLDTVGPGTHSYRVTAIRDSAARSSGRPSAPSEALVISIQGPAPPAPDERSSDSAARVARGGFETRSGGIAPRGLPLGADLPGGVGLPNLPVAARWGTYEPELPYEIPKGGIPLSAERTGPGASWTFIPTDGLRWVAAGALLLALAALLRLQAQRLDAVAGPPPLSKPARSLKL